VSVSVSVSVPVSVSMSVYVSVCWGESREAGRKGVWECVYKYVYACHVYVEADSRVWGRYD